VVNLDKVLLSEMNGEDVKEAVGKADVAIVPFGSTENHGGHLPFGTDCITPSELSLRIAERCGGAIVLPTQPYGVSPHHASFLMTMSLRPETLKALATDLLLSLLKHGIRNAVIINGHDGNSPALDEAAKEVKGHGMFVATLDAWWVAAGELLPKSTFEVWSGLGHGGEGETSMILHLRPDLVDMRKARGVVPHLPKHLKINWKFEELAGCGSSGAPDKASAEKGYKIAESIVNYVCMFITEARACGWNVTKISDLRRKDW